MKLLNVLYYGFGGGEPMRMGRLAWYEQHAWFEYSAEFLQYNTNPVAFLP